MKKTIFGFILAYTKKEQITLAFVTLLSFPFLYYSLDLPKIIINDAINGGDGARDLLGAELNQFEYLFILCGLFLLLVLINGGFKYFINVYRGRMAELMLRRIRYILYSQVLRFPLPHFSKLSQGEIVSIVTAEAEPLGGFFGEAFSLPLYQGGFLVTILGFIALQNPFMGVAAIAFFPLQMWLMPKLQSRVNALAKQRVMNVRKISERIGETVDGVQEVHANDTSQYELAGISQLLARNFNIRLKIYKRKFLIKFLNNFIAQITPFFFYSIGGYLVIVGDLSFGALVASLAAYKDLATPWKELLSWYQRKEDTRIKYDQLVERFNPDGMMDENLLLGDPDQNMNVTGKPITTANLGWEDDGGVKAVDGVSLHVKPGENILIYGGGGSGKDRLARMLARILPPTTGNVNLGGDNIATYPESITGRDVAFASSDAFMFNGTISENLLYGLNHRPGEPTSDLSEEDRELERQASILVGNSPLDRNDDWINYQLAGLSGPEQLTQRVVSILTTVGLDSDVYAMGLQSRIDNDNNPKLCDEILKLRSKLSGTLNKPEICDMVEQFDAEAYNENASVAENLLFGAPVGKAFLVSDLANNAYVLEVLEKQGLLTLFAEMGLQAATTMLDIFSELPPGHEFFERYGFIDSEDLPVYGQIQSRVQKGGMENISPEETSKLLSLPFNLTVSRHRLGIVTKEIQAQIVEARKSFRKNLPESLKGSIEFFDVKSYNRSSTIQNNILFGHLSYNHKDAKEQISAIIREAVDESGLFEDLMILGLEYSAGIGGKRIAPAQRQKISLARCLLKRPKILILDEILSALEADEKKTLIKSILSEIKDGTLIFIDSDDTLSEFFDRKLFMQNGRLIEAAAGEPVPEEKAEEEDKSLANEIRHLAQIPMFASFDSSTLKLLAFTSKRITFEPGQEIFHQNEKAETAYIILDGHAEMFVESGKGEIKVRDIAPNDLIGEIALLSNIPRVFTVRARTQLTTLELSKQQYFSLIEQDHRIALEMLRQLSVRLTQATSLIAENPAVSDSD